MRCRKSRFGRLIRRHTSSAILCAAGLGAVGCTGGHLDLSSRWPGLAARTGDEPDQVASARDRDNTESGSIERTGLARVLPFRGDAEAESKSSQPAGAGRVFSAFVDRLSGRQHATRDPFLDQRSVASTPSESAGSGPRTPTAGIARTKAPTQPVAARATTPSPQAERSDAELWQMFNADVAGTASVRAAAQKASQAHTSAPVAGTPSTPSTSNSLPLWAQAQSSQSQAASTARKLPPLVAHTTPPRSQQENAGRVRINPSSKPETVPTAPAITRREADLRLEQLLAEARSHQAAGNLFEAYRIAVIAEQFAEREHIVFAPRQERPVDIVREVEGLMQASLSKAAAAPAVTAPPTIVADQPPAGPVAVATTSAAAPVPPSAQRRAADPFADTAWQTQRPVAATAATTAPARGAAAGERFDSEFPALHEWRGVRANGPVSLAVGNSEAEAMVEPLEQPVQHALATGDVAVIANRAPLLARAEADRHQVLVAGQGTSLFSGDLRSPALAAADHPDLRPVAVPAPPPLEVAQPAAAAAAAGTTRSSRNGLVWWVLGGLAALTGAVALRSRHQPAGRR